jgi:hypothetical protein
MAKSRTVGRLEQLQQKPLWTCPKCGVKLVSKNLSHSCGHATLADWRSQMGPRARALYARFEEMIAACGEYYVSPAKTRITFLVRVRFAGITKVGEDGMTCSFALPNRIESSRFAKVEEVVPGWWVHWLKVVEPAELDDQVQDWIRESYRLMGKQQRLKPRTTDTQPRRLPRAVVAAIDKSKILGIRAGARSDHRFIGIWAVVVDGRVFGRSWTLKPGGWYRTLLEDPIGVIQVGERQVRIRAKRARGTRISDAVERAYAEKYATPGSLKYVRGFRAPRRRESTMEFLPR